MLLKAQGDAAAAAVAHAVVIAAKKNERRKKREQLAKNPVTIFALNTHCLPFLALNTYKHTYHLDLYVYVCWFPSRDLKCWVYWLLVSQINFCRHCRCENQLIISIDDDNEGRAGGLCVDVCVCVSDLVSVCRVLVVVYVRQRLGVSCVFCCFCFFSTQTQRHT